MGSSNTLNITRIDPAIPSQPIIISIGLPQNNHSAGIKLNQKDIHKIPEILEKTLKSWSKYAFKNRERFRFIMNIDNIGSTEEFEPIVNVELVKKYGFENIVYRINDKG